MCYLYVGSFHEGISGGGGGHRVIFEEECIEGLAGQGNGHQGTHEKAQPECLQQAHWSNFYKAS